MSHLSAEEAVIGQLLEVYLTGGDERASLLPNADALTVHFEGQYLADDGAVDDVSWAIGAIYDGLLDEGEGLHALRISRLGPFASPFTGADQPGRFEGAVRVVAETDGAPPVAWDPSGPLTLAVQPSIVIERLEPVEADCGAPALRALAGLAYRLDVRAVGIEPARFVYRIDRANGAEGPVEFTHEVGPTDRDTVGVDEALVFDPVPDDERFYVTTIRVSAEDAAGGTVETALPLTVHRPLEVTSDGRRELAQRYAPELVSGCIPGAVGSQVTYNETRREIRQRAVTVTIDDGWAEGSGVGRAEDWFDGVSGGPSRSRAFGRDEATDARERYGVEYQTSEDDETRFGTVDGEAWTWSRRAGEDNDDYAALLDALYGAGMWSGTVGAAGRATLPELLRVTGAASTSRGVRAGGVQGERRSGTSGRGFSTASLAGDRAFGSVVTDARSQGVAAGAYALGRAPERTFQDPDARAASRTYDFSLGAPAEDVISVGLSEPEGRTWMSSSSDQTIQAFTGFVPRDRVGVFYRQTNRWVRRAEIRGYDRCGLAEHIGEIHLHEWSWSPDLAIGGDCAEAPPPSNLEPAACFVEPCD